MSFISRGVWKCDDCGHEWLAGTANKPARCPSRKCRSTHWDHDGVPVDEPAQRQKVVLKTDAVATAGGKVTVSREVVEKAAEGRGHDYANCRNRFCLICKLHKEG